MAFPDLLQNPSRTILTAEGGSTPSRFKHIIKIGSRYRRLTPIELERLNGFPDNWTKLFPNQQERERVMRLNRMNVPVTNRSWIVVPTDFKDLSYLDLSPFPHQIEGPVSREQVVVDLSDQAFAAYDSSGKLVYWGPISGGKALGLEPRGFSGSSFVAHIKF
jgi:hypothetical protein